jgi:hypothetical protein
MVMKELSRLGRDAVLSRDLWMITGFSRTTIKNSLDELLRNGEIEVGDRIPFISNIGYTSYAFTYKLKAP